MKLFIAERGTEAVIRLCEQTGDRFRVFSAITPLEVHSALQRRCRAGDLTNEQVQDALGTVAEEMRRTTQMPLTQTLLQGAQDVIGMFQLRAPDAIQLASALAFAEAKSASQVIFVSSDIELLAAAESAGLEILNPAVL